MVILSFLPSSKLVPWVLSLFFSPCGRSPWHIFEDETERSCSFFTMYSIKKPPPSISCEIQVIAFQAFTYLVEYHALYLSIVPKYWMPTWGLSFVSNEANHVWVEYNLCTGINIYWHYKVQILIISYLSCFISSLATLPGMWERTVTIGSAGKTFSVTGWKVRDSAHIIFQLILTKLDYE